MFEQDPERDREQGRNQGRDAARGAVAARYWEEFAQGHGQELVRCVAATMRRIGWRAEPSDVDELVQEVYCRVLDHGAPPSPAGWPAAKLWAYLHRTARSVVVDELRCRCARKRGGVRRGEDALPRERCATVLTERRAPGATAEERLLARERASAVRRRVHELGGAEHGARNLRILELAAVEGYTAAEIAGRINGGLSASSVHTVLHRLRRQLLAAPGPRLAAMLGS